MNDFEQDIIDELRRRALDVHSATGLADAARRRARVIRRRRAAATGAAAALALAVAVPGAMSLGGGGITAPQPAGTIAEPTVPGRSPSGPIPDPSPYRTDSTPGPSTTAPSSDEASPGASPGGSTVLTLDDLPAGAPPAGVGWTDDSTFVRADGTEVPLPDGVRRPVAYHDGMAGQDWSGYTVVVFESDDDFNGRIIGRGPAVSADGTELGVFELTERGDSRIGILPAKSSGEPSWASVPKGEQLEPVGFLGAGDLVSNAINADGVSLGVRRHVSDRGADLVAATPPWKLQMVTAVSQSAQLVAGFTELNDGGSCSAVYEASGREPLWRTCDYSFDHFSPDGRLLVGGPAYRDGLGDSLTVVIDASTGHVVREFSVDHGYIAGTAFEDDSTVLVDLNMYTEGDPETRQALVRCDLEGRCELTTRVETVKEGRDAYSLGVQP